MSTATTATIPSQHASVFPPPADFRLPTSDFRLPTSDFQARPLLRIRCSTFQVCVDSLAPARLARMRAAVPTVSRAATLAAWVTGYTFDLPSSRRRYRAGVAPRLHVRLAHYAKALSRGCCPPATRSTCPSYEGAFARVLPARATRSTYPLSNGAIARVFTFPPSHLPTFTLHPSRFRL